MSEYEEQTQEPEKPKKKELKGEYKRAYNIRCEKICKQLNRLAYMAVAICDQHGLSCKSKEAAMKDGGIEFELSLKIKPDESKEIIEQNILS